MKLYEVIVLKPERVVIKTNATGVDGLGRMLQTFVNQMDREHGIQPVLHSSRRIEKDEEDVSEVPSPAA